MADDFDAVTLMELSQIATDGLAHVDALFDQGRTEEARRVMDDVLKKLIPHLEDVELMLSHMLKHSNTIH